MSRRCVASKQDPAIFDLGFLLAYKQLATPSRWLSIEDLAENLLTETKQHINIEIERRLSKHAELLKDRARYETYLATGEVPKGPTEDVRCWRGGRTQPPRVLRRRGAVGGHHMAAHGGRHVPG